MVPQQSPRSGVRLAEMVAALSLATDLGMGQPMEFALRTCVLAVRLGELLGLDEGELREVYYVALLRSAGCTAEAPFEALLFGDEIAARVWLSALDAGQPSQMLAALVQRVGAGAPPLQRARMLGKALTTLPRLPQIEAAHCEVAQLLTAAIGLGRDIQRAVSQVFERWDGRGPNHVRGEAIARAARVVAIAFDAIFFCGLGGVEAAVGVVRQRSGGKYDPTIAARFGHAASRLLELRGEESAWDAALAAEPGAVAWLSEQQVDAAAQAIGAFADLLSPAFAGHSRGVADLAAAAALHCRLPTTTAATVRRAGLVHDVGRAAVSASIWNKPGSLGDGERERVRLHPYYTERVFARTSGLAQTRVLAALHHERLDASGYHRGAAAAAQSMPARILAAADVYHALLEPRSHRPPHAPEAAAAELNREVRAGRLDGEAVNAVLAAAGHAVRVGRRVWPAGLSEREVEVLRLVARGRSNQQIGQALVVSPRTAGNHIQHIYDKLGVSTRAAATLFAMQHNILKSVDLTQE